MPKIKLSKYLLFLEGALALKTLETQVKGLKLF